MNRTTPKTHGCRTTRLWLSTLVALSLWFPALAQFDYRVEDGSITIVRYTGDGGAVDIPLGQGSRQDPNPANNRLEGMIRRVVEVGPVRDGAAYEYWASCVVFWILSIFQGEWESSSAHDVPSGQPAARPSSESTPPDASLSVYYTLRAWMRTTEAGQFWVKAYERHSPELVQILNERLAEPGFIEDAVRVLQQFEGGFARYLGGIGEDVLLGEDLVELLNRLADRFLESASPELRDVIESARARFNHLQDFAGRPFADWGRVLDLGVPEDPWVQTSEVREMPDGRLRFDVNLVPDRQYSIWRSDSLDPPVWRRIVDAALLPRANVLSVTLPGFLQAEGYSQVRME
ncbi:MAG: hypothetical protein KF791_00555 [Verrucomicrobiae bacterium]|nr:hypothetical protein [Verrucomicrobiae bacterium]